MYRITIIDEAGEHDLDLLESSFPFNFESNDVAQLNDSTASWSYSISLPRTLNNERLFGLAGIPFVNSQTPYQQFVCNVYAEGLRIINKGVLIIDKVTNKEYKVQILAGTASVFDLMKSVDFKNWKNASTVMLASTEQPSNRTPGLGTVYTYPMDAYVIGSKSKQIKTKNGDFYYFATPLIRVGSVNTNGTTKKLFTSIGYTLETDTPDSELDKLFLSMVTRKKAANSNVYMWRSSESSTGSEHAVTNGGKSQYGYSRFIVTIKVGNYYNSHQQLISLLSCWTSYIQAGGFLEVYIYGPNNTLLKVDSDPNTWVLNESARTMTKTIDLDNSDQNATYWVHADENYSTQWQIYDGSQMSTFTGWNMISEKWRVQTMPKEESDYAMPGQRLNLHANCGIANGMDYFKILSQYFGWTIKVDHQNRVVYARTFDYIANRKTYAPDWTNKIAMNEDTETDFDIGDYAQENIVRFAENKVAGYQDAASFAINNANLGSSKVLLDVKVSSGRDDVIEQWQVSDDGKYKWKDSQAPHLIKWLDSSSPIEHITPGVVISKYTSLIETLQSVKLIRLKMLLSVLDIYTFDQFTPIFLRQYGRYFYVNKISNWEAGKLCDVELLQLTF